MVQSIAINANGDMYLDASGNVAMLSGAAAVAQNCVTAMRAQRGEMQYAMSNGMPSAATAFDTYDPVAFEAAARKIIKGVTGVTGIASFAVVLANNALNYSVEINTIYGTTTVQGIA
jgi:hypothetical protein